MTAVAERPRLLAPAERTVTLPGGLPDLTLGWGAIAWIYEFLRHANGPRAGQHFKLVESQVRFLLWWYALHPDGRWVYGHGVRRWAKGAGKSPFAAAHALLEMLGPVRPVFLPARPGGGGLDLEPAFPGGVKGRPQPMPLIQIAATSESQTANTMRQIRAMTAKKAKVVRDYSLDTGKTVIYAPGGGQLEVITSSASAAEGAEVTFAVQDETEHWKPATGGDDLAEVLSRNLGKSGSRAVETANAFEPGAGSVAESTFDAWVMQEEGRTLTEELILYDARIAPPECDIYEPETIDAGLALVYGDCFWVNQRGIKAKILSPRSDPDESERFYLNRPKNDAANWVTQQEWSRLTDINEAIVADGDDIALFFDGSRTQDGTALIGCHIETGYIFTIGVWEPVQATAHDKARPISVAEVDAAVAMAFDKWNPVVFWADVREWESYVKTEWPKLYKDRLSENSWAVPGGEDPQPIAWDMRTHIRQFTMACEMVEEEIREQKFRHDGDSRTGRHVVNARRAPNRWGVSISKETRASSKKIDAAVCVVGARMARRLYLAASARAEPQRKTPGRVWGFS